MAQVVLVDYNDSIRRAMRTALEGAGHRVTEAAHTDIALAQLRLAACPCVVLLDSTDLWSADASFVQAITADPILAGRHVYLLTTTDRPPPVVVSDHTTGLPLPILFKPFDTDILLTLVGQAAASITPATGFRAGWHRKRPTRLGRWDGGLHLGTTKRSAAKQSGQQHLQHLQRPAICLSNNAQGTTSAPRVAANLNVIQTMTGEKSEKRTKGIDIVDGDETVGKQLDATGQATQERARVGNGAGSDDHSEMRYAQGLAAGRTAAAADAPDFTCNDDELQMAWDVSGVKATRYLLAEQEEYCVGWARGYTRCAGEIEGEEIEGEEIEGDADRWEDEGGCVM